MRREKILLFLGFGLAWLMAAQQAEAQFCNISTPTSVAFGSYDVYGSFVDTTGTVRIFCIFASNVTVDLSRGNSPSYSPRYMVNGGEHLNYNLYLDGARTTVWGDNTGGSSHYGPVNLFFNGVNIMIWGRINGAQDVSAGAYTDSISATVNF